MDETLAVAAIDLGGRPHAVVDLKVPRRARRRSADRARPRLLRRLRDRRARQRAREGAVRALEPSPRRSGVQGVRARAARRLREGQAARADAAEHEGTAVIALIDYSAGNLTSVRKALAARRRRAVRPGVAGRSRSRGRRSSCPASATSARRAALDRGWVDGDPGARRRRDARCSASASACSGCSRAATKRPTVRASACSRHVLSAGHGCDRRGSRTPTPEVAGVKVPHVGWNSLDDRRATRRSSTGVASRRAGLLHAQLRRARHRRHRRRHRARRAVRGGRAARPHRRRAVPSGEVRRRRPADPAQLLRAHDTCTRTRGKRCSLVLCAVPNASSPASTSATARSSRASTSRACDRPAIRPSSRGATTREGIDELVILDITATLERRRALADTIRAVARELFIPLAVGGGIRTEDDAAAAVDAGADKVSLNTAALSDPALITTLADRYGSQAVVVAIDAKRAATRPIGSRSTRAAARAPAGPRRGRVGARGRGPRRRRDSADVDRSRRHEGRLRLPA